MGPPSREFITDDDGQIHDISKHFSHISFELISQSCRMTDTHLNSDLVLPRHIHAQLGPPSVSYRLGSKQNEASIPPLSPLLSQSQLLPRGAKTNPASKPCFLRRSNSNSATNTTTAPPTRLIALECLVQVPVRGNKNIESGPRSSCKHQHLPPLHGQSREVRLSCHAMPHRPSCRRCHAAFILGATVMSTWRRRKCN